MKHASWSTFLAALAAMLCGYFADFSAIDARALALPPLSLDGLLDEKLPEAPDDAAKMTADNSACYVCHGNYQNEEFVVQHGIDKVGCVDCHGKSLAHRDDEDNITPPDVMFRPETIKANCSKCHDTHDAAASKVIARWQERCPKKTDVQTLVCMDCHGTHRLKFRTVWWDKKTGKLIIRKEGERVKKAEDLTGSDADLRAEVSVTSDSQMH